MDAPPPSSDDSESPSLADADRRVAVAATFTADPIVDTLSFWARQFGLATSVALAPYNQVFQTLLDPASVFRRNRRGANFILLRFSDFGDDARESLDELISGLGQVGDPAVPHLVACCPDARGLARDVALGEQLAEGLHGMAGVYLLAAADVAAWYPVREIFDAHADAVGHIPYTQLYYAALGTALMRKLGAVSRPSHKAVALDCDGTLWKGVVGEDGVGGIEIDHGHAALQRFMVQQHDSGVLLCLASKNNDADVEEVFARESMPLRSEHIVASKIDWAPKPDNIRKLAAQLNIGLDSFVFLDDSPVECSQMKLGAPEVLTLQLPGKSDQIPRFVQHMWAFDRVRVTGADKRRTSMYRENIAREHSRGQAGTLEGFLQGLQLQVKVLELNAAQLPRAAQLTERTNQFNLTTIRRSEAELSAFVAGAGHVARVVHVIDRFGDYGVVGLMLAVPHPGALVIDTMLLSCRALGRGVEHEMLAALGKIALDRALDQIVMVCERTPKNEPARAFFSSLVETESSPHEEQEGTRRSVGLHSSDIAKLQYAPGGGISEKGRSAATTAAGGNEAAVGGGGVDPIVDRGREAELFVRIARELATPDQVLAAVQAASHSRRRDSLGACAPSSTETEQTIVELWEEILLIDEVGVHDSFLALGGNSLLATRCVSMLRDVFEIDVSLVDFFRHPTVAGLARAIEDAILREIEAM
ncbi:MAG: HAD-IIIC family phosphatase [Nannocystaceae bacterium]